MIRLISLLFLISAVVADAQNIDIQPSETQTIRDSWGKRSNLYETSWLKDYAVRNVGPTVQGGRISDITVIDPSHYYIAFASGGVFETKDKGITFTPVFDEAGALGIGDIAHAPSSPKILYVGTGENNSSRSSYAGSGIYKSEDGGKTWKDLGLAETQHIGRIIVHPENPDIVWVASMGALYSHNDGRGVYRSADGGNTWEKTLFINDSTGIIDLIINPRNPQQLWAAAWERTRKAWDFKGSGPGSGIYRSDDGGITWTKKMQGFPEGPLVGRIGLDISRQNPELIYAFLDNLSETKKEREVAESDKLKPASFRDMTPQHLLTMDNEILNKFLKDEGFPVKYTAEQVKKDVREGKYLPKDIADYFGDANSALFSTDVKGAELYRSEDGGGTWAKMNSYDLEGVNFTYGYYFGEIRVDPTDDQKLYILGVPLLKSSDGGKTYARLDTLGDVHVDHQAMWIDPENSKHILLGNDGGLYETYNEGANWHHINNMPVGQFYTVNYDMQTPYHIYGGTQDNGTLTGSSKSVPGRSKDWDQIFGGDGMFVAPVPENPDIVYTGFQFGNYFRINRSNGKRESITPKKEIGGEDLRFNWRTPLIMSTHNSDIIYIGAQKVFRSLNQGKDWTAISDDLTHNYPQGNVPFSTISSLAESPINFGQLYVGTDDGRVHRTGAPGSGWQELTGLPENLWVSSIQPSSHDANRLYITLNGYRFDDFKTYVYSSTDNGKSWTSLKANLPEVVVNVIAEDPINGDLLYLGTDHGTYVSFNRGGEWHLLTGSLNVASYDIKVHPRDKEVIIGTHGRSIVVADAAPMQELAEKGTDKNILAFQPSSIRHSESWGESRYPYTRPNIPSVELQYFTSEPGTIQVEIYNPSFELIRRENVTSKTGFNTFRWDLKGGKYNKKSQEPLAYIKPGKYKVEFKKGGAMSAVFVEIK